MGGRHAVSEGHLPGAIAWGTPHPAQLAPFSERSYLRGRGIQHYIGDEHNRMNTGLNQCY